jgi:hypothetical protein
MAEQEEQVKEIQPQLAVEAPKIKSEKEAKVLLKRKLVLYYRFKPFVYR